MYLIEILKINARKIFSINQLSVCFVIKEKKLVHVIYHENMKNF